MVVREIHAKSVLSKSGVYEYTVNPYVGCAHACTYCYARFMKRFPGHLEPWGQFVDAKVNAPEVLASQIKRKKPGRVWISGVCDPYQPIEEKYRLTRRCLEILLESGWPVTIQTKSPLVLRDLSILKGAQDVEVCLSIGTGDDGIRRLFELAAPPIPKRIDALSILHSAGVRTSAMVAPILPGAERLPGMLKGKVDEVLVDKLNYHYADWVYRKHGMEWAKDGEFFARMGEELKSAFEKEGISCEVLF